MRVQSLKQNLAFMKKLTLVGLVLSVITISGCGGDEETPLAAPEASFEHEISGKTVVFTNTTVGEEVTYAWDFGDGGTSTEESPTYTFEANGTFVVKLTATNESGSDPSQAVLEIINITIDGDFSDWSDTESVNTGGGTVKLMKIENLENNKLFLYVEGTDLTPLTQIFLNTDNDLTTGAFIDWYYASSGEDYLVQGNLPQNEEQYGEAYSCEPCDGSAPGNWNWAATATVGALDGFIVASAITSVSGGMAYELSIDLTALGSTISSEAIGIAVLDISLDTWGSVGAVPALLNAETNPEAAMYIYTFK
ncbi:MAG: PKD domain-containing protein [Marinoscillum sp.]